MLPGDKIDFGSWWPEVAGGHPTKLPGPVITVLECTRVHWRCRVITVISHEQV